MKVYINGVYAMPGDGSGWDVLAGDGDTFRIGDAQHMASCAAHLPRGGGILLSCKLMHPNEQIYATPALLVRDGQPSAIDVTDAEHAMTFRLEFNASTSQDRVAFAAAVMKERFSNNAFKLEKP